MLVLLPPSFPPQALSGLFFSDVVLGNQSDEGIWSCFPCPGQVLAVTSAQERRRVINNERADSRPACHLLCDLHQVAQPLWALVFPTVRGDRDS